MQEVVLSRSHRKALLKGKGENAGYKHLHLPSVFKSLQGC